MSAESLKRAKINKSWYNIDMNQDELSQSDYDKPVAYSADGQPLYAHPPVAVVLQPVNTSKFVHMSRSVDPEVPVITDAVREKYEKSKMLFPELNISEGEYIISAVRRHPIGLFVPMSLAVILITFALIILFNYDLITRGSVMPSGVTIDPTVIIIPVIIFISMALLGAYISYYVYFSNRLFVTNESVIQEIQSGLFSKSEQTVNLNNIEDASYTQIGIFQQLFNFGSIRLSTEGEETTYRFTYVANPKGHIDKLNNAIEAFKNGRPPTAQFEDN